MALRIKIGFQDFLVLFAAFTLLALQMSTFADDPGVGWHLMNGRWIVEHGTLPVNDPFLSSAAPRPWISDQWLSDVMFYKVYLSGGWPLLYAALTLLYLLTYWGVVYCGVKKICGSSLAAALAAFVAFKTGEIHFILRASMIGFFFFSVLSLRLLFLLRESKQPTRSDFLGFPLLFILWANLHPSFVLGLAVLAVYVAAHLLDRLFLDRILTEAQMRAALWLAVLCCLATLLNPWGIRLHESAVALGQSDYFMKLHQEWLSPDFREPEGKLFEFIFLLIALALFLNGRGKARWGFFEFILLFLFAHLGLGAVRMLPYFSIAAAVPLADAVLNLGRAGCWERIGVIRGFFDRLARIDRAELEIPGAGLALLILAAYLPAHALLRNGLPFFHGTFGPTESFPYHAVRSLAASAPGSTVVAAPEWGGFIVWESGGRLRPVIDDRNFLIGEEFYREFFRDLKPGGDWRTRLRALRADFLLLREDSALRHYLKATNALEVVQEDARATLFKVSY